MSKPTMLGDGSFTRTLRHSALRLGLGGAMIGVSAVYFSNQHKLKELSKLMEKSVHNPDGIVQGPPMEMEYVFHERGLEAIERALELLLDGETELSEEDRAQFQELRTLIEWMKSPEVQRRAR